jgi:biotin carboxylase
VNAPAPGAGGEGLVRRVLVASRGPLARRVVRLLERRGLETVAVFAADEAEADWLEVATYDAYLGDGPTDVVWRDCRRFVEAAMDAGCEAIHLGDEPVGDDLNLYALAAESNVGVLGTEPRRISEVLDRARLSSRARQAHLPVVPRSDPLPKDSDGVEAAARLGLPLLVGVTDIPGGERVDSFEALAPALARARTRGVAWLERVVTAPVSLGVVVVVDSHGTMRHVGTTRRDVGGVVVTEPPEVVLAGTERLLRETGFVGLARARWWVTGEGTAWFDSVSPRLSASVGPIEAATGQDLVALQLAVGLGERA